MLEVKVNNKSYSIKKESNEFLIGEYESIMSIINDESLDEIDKYSQLFAELGVPLGELEQMETLEFFKLIKSFTGQKFDVKNFTKEIIIEGRTYKAFDDKFFLTVKDMKIIERFIKKNDKSFVGDIMAIVFKDVNLTKNEHYVDAHVKHKAKLFRNNVSFDIAIPYISYFSKEVIESLQMFKEIELTNED
jgi:hypothetical protein